MFLTSVRLASPKIIISSVLIFGFFFPSSGACAENEEKYFKPKPVQRLALVLSNWKYNEPLPGPENDGKEIAEKLRSLGFDVTTLENFRSKEELQNDALYPFLRRIKFGDFVLIYFTGHGISPTSQSYLLQTKPPETIEESDFKNKFISIEELSQQIEDQGPGVGIVVLDACRTYNGIKIIRGSESEQPVYKGLAPPSILLNTNMALMYAAQPGHAAIVKEQHSLFTQAFVEVLNSDGIDYETAKREINNRVLTLSNNAQRPWYTDSLTAIVRFKMSELSRSVDREAWDVSLGAGTKEAVERYLRTFPMSDYANAAKEWLRDNPNAPQFATSTIPPVVVASAWKAQVSPERTSGEKLSNRIQFPKSDIVRSSQREADKGTAKTSAERSADWITSSSRVKISEPATAELEPKTSFICKADNKCEASTHIGATKILPKGTVVQVIDGTSRGDNTYIRGKVDSIDDSILIKLPPSSTVLPEIGIPAAEGLIRIDPNSSETLVESDAVRKLLTNVKQKNANISRVSVEIGEISCAEKTASCERIKNAQAFQALHVESILTKGGISRNIITTLRGVSGIPQGSLRLRFFRK